MKITIHRGSKEIGGTVIELSTKSTTILLDAGSPLNKNSKNIDISPIKADAVLISHPHQDHYGLIDKLDTTIPVYIGKVGKELIDATRMFINREPLVNNFHFFNKWQPFMVGDFTITPYLLDHSSVDAYGFLVEAEGKKLYYSGDFRATGNKGFLFERLLKDLPKDIDLMLMEGTMMRRRSSDFPDEKSVRSKIDEVLQNQENISFLICSSQNIDRLVSAVHACQNTGKIFVVDIYTAWVLEKVSKISGKTPTLAWEQVKVYLGHSQHEKMKSNRKSLGDFAGTVYKNRVTREELHANPSRYLFLVRMSMAKIMDLYKANTPINVIYSQWLGYLKFTNDDWYGAEDVAKYQNDQQVNFIYAHTSGHATRDRLKELAETVQPACLVPIHTEYPEDYDAAFSNVYHLSDSESLDVSKI